MAHKTRWLRQAGAHLRAWKVFRFWRRTRGPVLSVCACVCVCVCVKERKRERESSKVILFSWRWDRQAAMQVLNFTRETIYWLSYRSYTRNDRGGASEQLVSDDGRGSGPLGFFCIVQLALEVSNSRKRWILEYLSLKIIQWFLQIKWWIGPNDFFSYWKRIEFVKTINIVYINSMNFEIFIFEIMMKLRIIFLCSIIVDWT